MIEIKQIERLYHHSYISYFATYFGAALAFWLFQNISETKVLNIWFIVFSVLTLIRVFISWRFIKSEHKENIEFWFILFLIMSAISGTMWGLTGFVFIPKGSLSLLDSVLYHGILLLFISTLIAGSIVTYSASKTVYLVFSLPAVVPQCLLLVAQGDQYHSFLGGVVLAYAFIMFIISIYIHRVFIENSKIESRNDFLELILKKNGIKVDD
jgi:hypothetical protein